MSSPTLGTKPEEKITFKSRTKHTVSIVECKNPGVLQAILFAEAGYRVTCFDGDQTTVNNIAKGKTSFLEADAASKLKNHARTGLLSSTSDIRQAVSGNDIILVTTPVRINTRKKAEYSDLENACKRVGSNLQRGSLVIITSLTGIGIVEGLIRETLENNSGLKAGTDFGLAYSPFQMLGAATLEEAQEQPRIVAASDGDSLIDASTILEAISKKTVKRATNLKTAEMIGLLEVLRRDASSALANETAVLCERTGIDGFEVQKILGNEPYGPPLITKFRNDSFNDEPYLLLEDAENLNLKPRIATGARETNEEATRHIINLAKDGLDSCGKTLKRAKIACLGASRTPNTRSPFKRGALRVVESLEARGAKTTLYDPYLSNIEMAGTLFHIKKTLNEALERADCILIVTAHDQFKHLNLRKMKHTMRMPAAIVDLEGITEPSKIEKEGFVYRGLGRGVWTK